MSEIKAGVLLSLKDKFSQGIKNAGSGVEAFASKAAFAVKGIDKAFSGLGTVAGALGVSLSVGAATKEIISLDNRLTRIGLTADASAEQIAALKQKVFDAASDSNIKIDTTSINDALDVVMTKTGDLKYVEDNIRNIAIAIQATGEQGSSIGSVFSEFQKFGYTADQISKLMDDMVKQGDQGAFTFGEFAKAGSAVISAYSPIGTAPDDIKRANAAMQIIMMGTKSAEIAVTALGSAMAELSSPDKQAKLMAIGVRVRDESGKFRDFNDIMADLLKISEKVGNTDFLGSIFGQSSMQAIRAYGNFYKDMYPKLMDLGDTTGAMESKSATMARTLAANLQQVRTAFVRFADSGLTKPLKMLADLLNYLAEKPERYSLIFKTIAAGIALIGVSKGAAAVMNLVSAFKSFKGGGSIKIGSGIGGAGMPVYVTNWGGKPGASPFPNPGTAGKTKPAGKTPSGLAAGTYLNSGSQGNALQKMGGAASLALKGVPKALYMGAGAAAGIGEALVAVPRAKEEIESINADETLSEKQKAEAKGGAVGDAAGSIAGAAIGGAGGIAAGAAAGAAVGSIIPGLGTAAGLIVGGIVGLVGTKLGGMAGRKLGETIGGAMEKDDETESQIPENAIPAENLPPEITSQHTAVGSQWHGASAEIAGQADVNLNLTLTDKRTMFTAETSRNTSRNIRVNTGSAVEARSMI